MSHTILVADINVGHGSSIAKGLTAPWDTNVGKPETQILAGGSIWDTFLGTWRAASPDDFSIGTEPNTPRMYWVSNLDFFASLRRQGRQADLARSLRRFDFERQLHELAYLLAELHEGV